MGVSQEAYRHCRLPIISPYRDLKRNPIAKNLLNFAPEALATLFVLEIFACAAIVIAKGAADAPLPDRVAHYEHHMKCGPTRDYWTEFVFEAYVNHRTDVIFLAGLPDVPESRPHSRVNQR